MIPQIVVNKNKKIKNLNKDNLLILFNLYALKISKKLNIINRENNARDDNLVETDTKAIDKYIKITISLLLKSFIAELNKTNLNATISNAITYISNFPETVRVQISTSAIIEATNKIKRLYPTFLIESIKSIESISERHKENTFISLVSNQELLS